MLSELTTAITLIMTDRKLSWPLTKTIVIDRMQSWMQSHTEKQHFQVDFLHIKLQPTHVYNYIYIYITLLIMIEVTLFSLRSTNDTIFIMHQS